MWKRTTRWRDVWLQIIILGSPQRDMTALAAAAVWYGHPLIPMTFSAVLDVSDLHALIRQLSLAVGLFLRPALTLQSAVPASPSPSNSFSFFVCRRILTFFRTIPLLLCISSFTLTAALRPWHDRFGCGTRATHCPCQLKTGPVSSRHTHMSMVYTRLFTSSLMTVPSRLLRMYGFFSSSTTTLPACTTFLIEMKGFTTFALLNCMHLCTPSTDLNVVVFLSNVFDLFSMCCNEFICCARAIQFHSREHLCGHDMPCSCVHCGSDVQPICL